MLRSLFLIPPFFSFVMGAWAQTSDPAESPQVIARYQEILERSPGEGPALDRLIQIYQTGEGLEKLDAKWAQLINQPGHTGQVYELLRGILADRRGKEADAAKWLTEAANAMSDDFHGWLALGDFQTRQGKLHEAIDAFQKGLATKVTGNDRLALFQKLGHAQERNLDSNGALLTWQNLVKEFPQDKIAVEEAGTALLDANQFDAARTTFQKLVDLTEPNSMNRVQAMMHLAEVDDRQGKPQAAVHDYEDILPQTAEGSWLNKEIRSAIEQIYRREDDLPGLVSYYQKWSADNPNDVDALLLLSAAQKDLGNKADAIDSSRKAAQLAPDRHEVRESLAVALVEANQNDEAITVLNALTADDPTEPRYWQTLGEALWQKTQPSTDASKKAVLDAWGKIAPPTSSDIAAVLEVADLCRQYKFNDEALAGYKRALAISPDALDVRQKAVSLLVETKREADAWALLDSMTDGPNATAGNFAKLAQLQEEYGRDEASAGSVQKGLALEPNNFDLLSVEWDQLIKTKDYKGALALADQLRKAAPGPAAVEQVDLEENQALAADGQTESKLAHLKAKLGQTPGLSEDDLRLLLRLMVQAEDPDLPKAFAEVDARFPKSPSLTDLEVESDRKNENFDGALAALEKLLRLQPQQRNDVLTEEVRILREAGKTDEAMKTAQRLIDASPANADGYLLLADVATEANKPDVVVTNLVTAIKFSSSPNDVRLKLARYYQEQGSAQKAQNILEEAFTAAAPEEKLSLIKPLTDAYTQTGQINDLIARFKQRQSAEEGGWRYGLYLAQIYQQQQDYVSARRELALSLAVRPQDASLLRSLVSLAEQSGEQTELLHYRQMLVTVDPTTQNQIDLATEYVNQGMVDDAWKIVEKNQTTIAKNLSDWSPLLLQFSDSSYAEKVHDLFTSLFSQNSDPFNANFNLAQLQIEQKDLDAAQDSLWKILNLPLPAATNQPVPTNTTPTQPGMINSPLLNRAQQVYMSINSLQMLLQSGNRGNTRGGGGYSLMGVTTTLTPQDVRDKALIYLAFISVQEGKADQFLAKLQELFASQHTPFEEQLVNYFMIQARDPLVKLIQEQSTRPANRDLDQFCFFAINSIQQFQNTATSGDGLVDVEKIRPIFEQRLLADPATKMLVLQLRVGEAFQDRTADAADKRKALIAECVPSMDKKNPQEIMMIMNLAILSHDWKTAGDMMDCLKTLSNSPSPLFQQLVGYLPNSVVGAIRQDPTMVGSDTVPPELIKLILDALSLGYSSNKVPASTSTVRSSHVVYAGGRRMILPHGGYSGSAYAINDNFPPPNQLLPTERAAGLGQLFTLIHDPAFLTSIIRGLDAQAATFPDNQKIYPSITKVYFQWLNDEKKEAIDGTTKLLGQYPSDDLRILLVGMYEDNQQYPEAVTQLTAMNPRPGTDEIGVERRLLRDALKANNNDLAKQMGQKLLLHHPTPLDLQLMAGDLNQAGLKNELAEAQTKTQSNPTTSAYPNPVQGDFALIQQLNQARRKGTNGEAEAIALRILQRDPLQTLRSGGGSNVQEVALNFLKEINRLDPYVNGLEEQLKATPDSLQVKVQLANALLHQSGQTIDRAMALYDDVIKQDKRVAGLLVPLAARLNTQSQFSASTDIYLRLLKSGNTDVLNYFSQIYGASKQCNRLPEILDGLEHFPAPMANFVNPNAIEYLFRAWSGVADSLRDDKDFANAEKFYRKALDLQCFDDKSDLVYQLATMLEAENRVPDAAKLVKDFLITNGTPAAPAAASGSILTSFGQPNMGQGNVWFNFRWNVNGVTSPIIPVLKCAKSLNVLSDVLAKLQEEEKSGQPQVPGNVKEQECLVQILSHDPGFKPLLDDLQNNSNFQGTNWEVILMASQLADWPEQRPLALKLLRQNEAQLSTQRAYADSLFKLELRVARQMGDVAATQDILQKERDAFMENASQTGYFQLEQALDLGMQMVAVGSLKDADAFCDQLSLTKEASLNDHNKQAIKNLRNAIQFASGEPCHVYCTGGVESTKGNQVKFYWYLSGETTNDDSNRNTCLVNPQLPAVNSRCNVEIKAGPDKEHLTSVATITNAQTRGDQAVTLPDQTNILVVTVTPPSVKAPPAPTDPSATGEDYTQPTVAEIPISSEPNLLKNPDLKFGSSDLAIPDWQGISTSAVEAGEALRPGGTAVEITSQDPQTGQETYQSSPVPIEPDTCYLVSGWVRGTGQLKVDGDRRSDKKDLIPGVITAVNFQSSTSWERICLPCRPTRSGRDLFILPRTESIGVTFVGTGDIQVSGFSIQKWDVASSSINYPKPPGDGRPLVSGGIVIKTDAPGSYHLDAQALTKDQLVARLKELYLKDPDQQISIYLDPAHPDDSLPTAALVRQVGFTNIPMTSSNSFP